MHPRYFVEILQIMFYIKILSVICPVNVPLAPQVFGEPKNIFAAVATQSLFCGAFSTCAFYFVCNLAFCVMLGLSFSSYFLVLDCFISI